MRPLQDPDISDDQPGSETFLPWREDFPRPPLFRPSCFSIKALNWSADYARYRFRSSKGLPCVRAGKKKLL